MSWLSVARARSLCSHVISRDRVTSVAKGVRKQSEKIVILLEQDYRLGTAAGRAVKEQH